MVEDQLNQGKSYLDATMKPRDKRHKFVQNKNLGFNIFHSTCLFLYSLETSEKQRFPGGIKRDQ